MEEEQYFNISLAIHYRNGQNAILIREQQQQQMMERKKKRKKLPVKREASSVEAD